MMIIFNNTGVMFDAPIINYLPGYWIKGPNVDQITFKNLLTHTSGISSGATDYLSMREVIENGVTDIWTYVYANMNFSLCRILLAVLNGNIAVDFDFAPNTMQHRGTVWDSVTTEAYLQFVEANIFGPSGSNGHIIHQFGDAIAYDYPSAPGDFGWDDGDCTTWAGAAGWHMSVNQLMDVMGTVRRGGNILSTQDAADMLYLGFGIDWTLTAPNGDILYAKNGWDWDGAGHVEQGVLCYLPDDLELVVFANSPVCWRYLPDQTLWIPIFLMSAVIGAYAGSFS
jgi:CubicO group peptidase (beta-lactamase class C family)